MRPFVTSDEPAVWALHKAALVSTGADRGDGPWDDDLRDITSNYAHAEGAFLVVTEEGALVAMGGVRQADDPETAEIKRMRVAPGYQRQGLGGGLLHALLDEARGRGYCRVVLDTTTVQIAAQRLYKSAGFTEVAREPIDGFTVIRYEKRLLD
ncbi:MAG: GNAT family N-acetyltransferase [Actinomycetota bacterium]